MQATDWLDAAVQRAKKKYQVQRTREEQLAHQEALKRRLGGQFCRELFAWFENIEVSFNNRFGGQVLVVSVAGGDGHRSVKVLARPIRAQESIAELNYEESSASLGLTMGYGTPGAAQVIRLILSAEGVILAEMGEARYTAAQLGQKIIDALLA